MLKQRNEDPTSQQSTAGKNYVNWLLVDLVVLLFATTSIFTYNCKNLKQQVGDQQQTPPVQPNELTITNSLNTATVAYN